MEGDTEFTSVKSKGYRDYGLSRISNTLEIHKDIFESFFNIITAVVFGLAGFIFILYLCVKSTSTIRNESLVASLSAQKLVLTGRNMYGIMIADFAIPGSVIEFSLDYEDVVSVDVSDVPTKYFVMGENITCGEWANEETLKNTFLDLRFL